jgi:ribosome biogenesis GTPase
MTLLDSYGITDEIRSALADPAKDGAEPARIITGDRSGYRVVTDKAEIPAQIAGKFRFSTEDADDLPVTGDWVAIITDEDQAIIHELYPRRTYLTRKSAGKSSGRQILAANVDTVFIIQSLDRDFNPRRLERYLVMAYDGGVEPVVLLSKRDLSTDDEVQSRVAVADLTAMGVPVLPYSAFDTSGVDMVHSLVKPGKTFCLVGSSGVGKSTLINQLLGKSRLDTQEVREKDSRGRHTTVRRELILLDGGGILIDTPGMRELGITADQSSLEAAFPEIKDLAEGCRYRDCRHEEEPGCAVLAAVESGDLAEDRYASYLKLTREITFHEFQVDEFSRLGKKQSQKQFSRHSRQYQKKWKSKF